MGQSWSDMRKQLEETNICQSLKGRIQYFATRYKKSHDEEGRVAIRLDGQEVLKSCFYDWYRKRYKAEDSFVLPAGKLGYWEYFDLINIETHNLAGFDQYGFYKAFYQYQNHSIEENLACPDPIVRLFTILDKRVGKRRLKRILPEVESQPEWLQFFYQLRLKSEGILSPDM